MSIRSSVPVANSSPLVPRTDGKGKIWSHLRNVWLVETPEEAVRQEYVCTLVNEYGYSLAQIDEEKAVAGKRGTAAAKADILIWRSVAAKTADEHAFIVVECKADNVIIDPEVYVQGSHYAQYEQARFFVAHNRRQTKVFKVDLTKRAPNYSEIQDIPHADATDKEVDELLSRLKTFKEHEFADLLHDCHNVIRNREHLDPAAAFDEIAKILFVKVWVERQMRDRRERNRFTVEWLHSQYANNPIQTLFDQTKETFKTDQLFAADEQINLRPATVDAIVKLLQAYNLSDTSEDVKGVAFERFLGRTFRGEIGQFFTPRPIVEFMIRFLDPQEGDVVCDPASGSGGFLIRFFEIVREKIAASLDTEYHALAASLEKKNLSATRKAKLLRDKQDEIKRQLDPVHGDDRTGRRRAGSRVWTLANQCIYGCDANDRMARTSKMNMIMHGDGHGGVHHHNGFLNVNGIYEGRFSLILTNPPFGANVESSDLILDADVAVSKEVESRYNNELGKPYQSARARLTGARGKPIASLFQLPTRDAKGNVIGKIKTELLFIERCLDLLKPGGRLGIVLPEGVFNNPSLDWVRTFVEDRARLLAVVSLPPETFTSSGASVKCSLLFLKKFTAHEARAYEADRAATHTETAHRLAPIHQAACEPLRAEIGTLVARKKPDAEEKARLKSLEKQLAELERKHADELAHESRALLKQRQNYPIFFYEAEKVGINAVGEPGENELHPNDRVPAGVTRTALELYRDFLRDPKSFFAHAPAA